VQRLLSRKGKEKVVEQVFQAQTAGRGRGRSGWKKKGRGRASQSSDWLASSNQN